MIYVKILKIIGITIGALFGLLVVLVVFVVIFHKPSTDTTGRTDTSYFSVTETPTPTEDNSISNAVAYEELQKWTINNGGYGKTILISESYLNEETMTRLGLQLKYDTRDDKNAFIMVFTDRKAALLRNEIGTGSLSKTDEDFYDKHYVGQYTKNGNSGFHAFAIYFDGVSGNNNKTIEY